MSKVKIKSVPLRPNGASGVKRGRISKDEDKAIARLLGKNIEVAQIAIELKRPVGQITEHVRKFYGKGEDLPAKASAVAEATRNLRKSLHWKFLQEHYRKEDLVYYEELYAEIMAQFKDDVTIVDELQILQAIDSHMFINEHKRNRRIDEEKAMNLEREINLLRANEDEPSRNRILVLDSQRQALLAQVNNRVKAFSDLSKKFDDTVQKLKSTRDQRLKVAENAGKNFIDLIKTMQNRKVREKEGKYAALVKFATEKATHDLQQPHKYINNEIDQPLLTPENILIDLPDESFEENNNEIQGKS